MRKTVFLSLSIICLLISYANADVKSEQQINIDKIIKEIRKEYAKINLEFHTYDKKILSLSGESTQGGSAIGYYKKGNLRKIEAHYYGEMGKWQGEYYYHNNICFFAFTRGFQYESSIYEVPDVKIVSEKEDRYYFNNEKLIRWISGKEVINPDSKEFIESGNQFIKDFKKYKDIFIEGKIEGYDAHWEGQEPVQKSSQATIDNKQAVIDQKFLLGKWVVKGGNPSVNVYTFDADNSFFYQYDDFAMSGRFIYNNGSIKLKIDKKYYSGEEEDSKEEHKYSIIKIDSVTISIADKMYKKIDSIKPEDNWYSNGNEDNDADIVKNQWPNNGGHNSEQK